MTLTYISNKGLTSFIIPQITVVWLTDPHGFFLGGGQSSFQYCPISFWCRWRGSFVLKYFGVIFDIVGGGAVVAALVLYRCCCHSSCDTYRLHFDRQDMGISTHLPNQQRPLVLPKQILLGWPSCHVPRFLRWNRISPASLPEKAKSVCMLKGVTSGLFRMKSGN